jgi:hypothetical protein
MGSGEILGAAFTLHEDLAPLINGLLEGLEMTGFNREKATLQVEALFSSMVDASKEFEPGVATLTVASAVDRCLDRLIGQSDSIELSRMASKTRRSLLTLSKLAATALREEGWNQQAVTLHVAALSEKMLRISRDYDEYIKNLTFVMAFDLYAKQLAEKLMIGRLEELSSSGIGYIGDGKSQQAAIFFTSARTQLEHIGLQHQFIRERGIAVVGARHVVGGEGGHLCDVWPTTEGQLWFKVPPDPDPRKSMKEMQELFKKRRGSSAESGDRPDKPPPDAQSGGSAPKERETDELRQAISKVLSALEEQGKGTQPRHLDAESLKQFLVTFSQELEKAASEQPGSGDVSVPKGLLLKDIECREMEICQKCYEVRGPWRPKGATETPGSRRSLFHYTQECKCDEALGSLNEEWPGFDFKRAVELCQCCGLEPVRSGSRWSVWFCDDCKEMVRQLHAKYQRYIVPIGRHSVHGGFGVTGEKSHDEAEVEYFAIRWKDVSEAIDHLARFARLTVSENLEKLGFSRDTDVRLVEYLAAVARNPLDKKAAFRRLCRFFEVEA